MNTVTSRNGAGPLARVARDLALALLPLLALSALVQSTLGFGWGFVAQVTALYLAGAILILRGVPGTLPGPGAGAANRVTLARALLVLPVVALALQSGVTDPALREAAIFLAGIALILDGVDGWVARKTGTGTAFGARFDMETDALLILALSVLAWRGGPVGPWILGIGALRYLFVAAGRIWPILQRELPPSHRRKVVCVVQGVALLIVLAPFTPPIVARAIGALALISLVGSFAVDTLWALRTPLPEPDEVPYRVRTRIKPSWATEATTWPSRVK
jgi:phosphatidylglycerophosphate synthase